MGKFQSFCKNIHKTDAGYVPDLLDLVAHGFGDLCMAAFLADQINQDIADFYMQASNEAKNKVYSLWESRCQDAIDAYNQTIDDARQPEPIYFDPHWKFTGTNAAQWDAGHKAGDFC